MQCIPPIGHRCRRQRGAALKNCPLPGAGAAVTTSRNDTDYVVTEYGIAWLRGLNIRERVEALVKIAHPDFRDWLREEAERNMIW